MTIPAKAAQAFVRCANILNIIDQVKAGTVFVSCDMEIRSDFAFVGFNAYGIVGDDETAIHLTNVNRIYDEDITEDNVDMLFTNTLAAISNYVDNREQIIADYLNEKEDE